MQQGAMLQKEFLTFYCVAIYGNDRNNTELLNFNSKNHKIKKHVCGTEVHEN